MIFVSLVNKKHTIQTSPMANDAESAFNNVFQFNHLRLLNGQCNSSFFECLQSLPGSQTTVLAARLPPEPIGKHLNVNRPIT
jgi:hypothetical protein